MMIATMTAAFTLMPMPNSNLYAIKEEVLLVLYHGGVSEVKIFSRNEVDGNTAESRPY